MFIIVQIEVKLDIFKVDVEYIMDSVIFQNKNYDETKAALDKIVEAKIKDGYFTKIINRTEAMVMITNGGSVYQKLMIREV